MTADASAYRQWWGFVRTTQEVVLREYRDGDEIREACDAQGVLHVRGPFIATKAAAMGLLKGKLAVAKSQASLKRILKSSPQKLLTHQTD